MKTFGVFVTLFCFAAALFAVWWSATSQTNGWLTTLMLLCAAIDAVCGFQVLASLLND